MQDNYFFDYLMKNPETISQTKASTVAFLQDCVRNGKKDIYSALRKDSTNCRSLTYQVLAEFSQDIYKILYPFLSEKHPGH